MNPFIEGPKEYTTLDVQLPIFKELAWDFDKDTFIYDEFHQPVVVTGNEALKVWIYKTLKTERYRYLAYFDDYGIILETYIGRTVNDEEHGSNLFFEVEDALLVNPYIKEIEKVEVINHEKFLEMKLKIRTIYGITTIGIEV